MTGIKQNQQTTKKSKVYIIRPPFPPQMKKNIACWGEVENAIFLQSRKNNTAPPPQKKNYPPKKKSSQVQSSPVQSSPVHIFQLAVDLYAK